MAITTYRVSVLTIVLACIGGQQAALAGEVRIVNAALRPEAGDRWTVSVTLEHADSGWEHYADEWRVLDGDGRVLGDRVLYHPHVDEQPFTRSLSGVAIPASVTSVYIEAHDTVHGWAPERLKVDLPRTSTRP